MKAAVFLIFALVLEQCEDNFRDTTVLQTEFSVGTSRLAPKDQVKYYEYVDGQGQPLIHFRLSDQDGQNFGDFTKLHIGKLMEMRVCSQLITTPIIREAIYGGTGVLPGADVLVLMQDYIVNGCP